MPASDQQSATPPGALAAADHVRSIIDALVSLPDGGDVPDHVNARLEEAAAELSARITTPLTDLSLGAYLDRSPVTGAANPFSPPLRMDADEQGVVRARASLGQAYQGPPRRVHGGFVATLLDHAMGVAASAPTDIEGALTRSLTVDYIAGTPLGEDIEVTAWIGRREGRKLWMHGEISAEGRTCVTAHGLWIAFDPDTYR